MERLNKIWKKSIKRDLVSWSKDTIIKGSLINSIVVDLSTVVNTIGYKHATFEQTQEMLWNLLYKYEIEEDRQAIKN